MVARHVVPSAFTHCCNLLTLTGGRFKKEVIIDGQSYLLLIRDEGGPPEMQVSSYLVCRIQQVFTLLFRNSDPT